MPNTQQDQVQALYEELQQSATKLVARADNLITQPDKHFYTSHLWFWVGRVASDAIDLMAAVASDNHKEEADA